MAVADHSLPLDLPTGEGEFTPDEARLLAPYLTNLERPVFALKNLPEVVKGALFSRYSRTEKSLRRVLLDEFLGVPELGLSEPVEPGPGPVATRHAEEFYERVLVGYGDDSVAELAGAHLAVERVSTLAAKALEDARIGLSPLEKSTRYVRFDRPGPDGRHLYHRGAELAHPAYEPAADALFRAFGELLDPVLENLREEFGRESGETERAWKTATRAKALDLLRGLLPAATLTNLGLFGNGRAFEYLLTKLAASDLAECRGLAHSMHGELSEVIPSFVRRGLDERYGLPAAQRLAAAAAALRRHAPRQARSEEPVGVRLIEHDPDAAAKVAAAALFPHSDLALNELRGSGLDVTAVLDAVAGDRDNRRQRVPRAFEHAQYTFEIVANFAAYRDLQRHRMLTQDRQLIGCDLGYDVPPQIDAMGLGGRFRSAMEQAAEAHSRMAVDLGPATAQYVVPLGFRIRWYFKVSLREVVHLCELRTTPQGHPDYRYVAQEMFRRVQEVQPELARYASLVDLGPGDELERRQSERRIDEKLKALGA